MDIGTISLVLLVGLLVLLAIGMPLGLASAVMAVAVLVMKFEPALIADPLSFGDGLLTRKFGTGPLNILAQKIYGLLTDYVLISIPLFIFMAALLERSGIAKGMYTSLHVWLSGVRGVFLFSLCLTFVSARFLSFAARASSGVRIRCAARRENQSSLNDARSASSIAPIASGHRRNSSCITSAAATLRLSESAKPLRGRYTLKSAAARISSVQPTDELEAEQYTYFIGQLKGDAIKC